MFLNKCGVSDRPSWPNHALLAQVLGIFTSYLSTALDLFLEKSDLFLLAGQRPFSRCLGPSLAHGKAKSSAGALLSCGVGDSLRFESVLA